MADHSDSNNFAVAVIGVETDPVLEAYIHLEMALLLALVLGRSLTKVVIFLHLGC